MKTGWATRLFFLAVALFLAAPIVVVAGVSVNEKKTLEFPPDGFSLAWYRPDLRRSGLAERLPDLGRHRGSRRRARRADRLSAGLVAMAAAVAPGRGIFQVLGLTPFILPPVITALGFLSFWATRRLLWRAVDGGDQPRDLLRDAAAGDADARLRLDRPRDRRGGARRWAPTTAPSFARSILPLVGPYILSGYAFAFVLSLNEYIVAYMVAGFTIETLPIKIFNSLRYGYTPTMAAVTVVFVAIAALDLRPGRALRRPAAASRRLGVAKRLDAPCRLPDARRRGRRRRQSRHDRGGGSRGGAARGGASRRCRSWRRPAMAPAMPSPNWLKRPTARRSTALRVLQRRTAWHSPAASPSGPGTPSTIPPRWSRRTAGGSPTANATSTATTSGGCSCPATRRRA